MHRGLVLLFLALTALGLAAAPTQADEASDETAAKMHYASGLRAYNTGDFDTAIKEWKTSYRLLGTPDFLFNIAQAYRQKRDYEHAIFFYNAYLRGKPDAANLAEVTALRDEMRSLHDKQEANEKMPPDPQKILGEAIPESKTDDHPGIAEATPENESLERAPPHVGRKMRVAGLIVSATGLALAAGGVAFAISASSTEGELEQAAARGEPWTDRLEDKEASGQRNGTIGTALVISGAAALVGGGVLYMLGHKRRSDSRLSSVPQTGSRVSVEPIVQIDHGNTIMGLSVGMGF